MILDYNNKAYEFLYYETENSWVAQKKIEVSNYSLFMEIHLKDFQEADLNWDVAVQFLAYLNEKLSRELDAHARELLNATAKVSQWLDIQAIDKYHFELEGIFFKEPKLPVFSHQEIEYNYSLSYKLYHAGFMEPYDPYTNYVVDFKNSMITGCKKE